MPTSKQRRLRIETERKETVDVNLRGPIDIPSTIRTEIRREKIAQARILKGKPKAVKIEPQFNPHSHLDSVHEFACCSSKCCATVPDEVLVHHIQKWHGFGRKQKTSEVFHYLVAMHAKRATAVREASSTGVKKSRDGKVRKLYNREMSNLSNTKLTYWLTHPNDSKKEYQVCMKALGKITGSFGGKLVARFNEMCENGQTEFYNDLVEAKKARTDTRTHSVMMWVEREKRRVADSMPTDDTKQWLPHSNWTEAYQLYKIAVEVEHVFADIGVTQAAGESLFRKIVKRYYRTDVKMESKYNTFTKCNVCSDYKINLRQTGVGSKPGRTWLKHYHRHLWWVAANRLKYHHHRTKAKCFPEKYLSLIFDGSDNHAFEVPVFGDKRKDWKGAAKPQSRTGGVLVHSASDETGGLHLYLTDERTKKGTNFWVTSLLHTLVCEAKRRNGKLPPFWYVQMDSAGDNKSKTMASFFEWLVKSGVCYKIKNCMLPVGHTHEDIDAGFGRLNRSVLQQGLKTVTTEQALACAKKAYALTRSIVYIKVRSRCGSVLFI